MLLSILIPTLPESFNKSRLSTLMSILNRQAKGYPVEILTDDRDRSVPTGTKRNDLKARATGKYIGYIDDDDKILPGYMTSILTAICEKEPDVVTFCGYITFNGKNKKDWVIKLGEEYEERNNVYYRFPNHLAVMKRELVQDVNFPDIWIGEDYQFACAVNGRDIVDCRKKVSEPLLKTEVHIDRPLYLYDFWSPELKKKLHR